MAFELDAKELPRFFVVVGTDNGHTNVPIGTVLAETDNHSAHGWVTVGFVSRQTPFGQGTYLGYSSAQLRKATAQEILNALEIDHQHGSNFRPFDIQSADLGLQLVFSNVFVNWTNDSGRTSILPFSRNDIKEARAKTTSDYQAIMARWEEIISEQKEIIRKQYVLA